MYKFAFVTWCKNGREGAEVEQGYNAWDYLPHDCPEEFPTHQDAMNYLAANHKGRDEFGISPTFTIVAC